MYPSPRSINPSLLAARPLWDSCAHIGRSPALGSLLEQGGTRWTLRSLSPPSSLVLWIAVILGLVPGYWGISVLGGFEP